MNAKNTNEFYLSRYTNSKSVKMNSLLKVERKEYFKKYRWIYSVEK